MPASKKYTFYKSKNIVEEAAAAYKITPARQHLSIATKNNYLLKTIQLLGLSNTKPYTTLKNEQDLIECMREGLPKFAMEALMEALEINTSEIVNIIHTSDRTLRRYTAKQKLSIEQSERIIELAKLYARGEDVLGDMNAFKEWMNSTVMALGNKKPKLFLDTSLGINILMDELGRIEHGIFA
jgi:putative toxin-antitoxin system antitoxin component (TIGR02293 family)